MKINYVATSGNYITFFSVQVHISELVNDYRPIQYFDTNRPEYGWSDLKGPTSIGGGYFDAETDIPSGEMRVGSIVKFKQYTGKDLGSFTLK